MALPGGTTALWPRLGQLRVWSEAVCGWVAAGWFAGWQAERDAVEGFPFGVAELGHHFVEGLDEGGQAVGAVGLAQVVLGGEVMRGYLPSR